MASSEQMPGVVTARAGWQCPECRTVYAPDVQACHCATVRPSLAERIGPDRHYWPVTVTRPVCTCPLTWSSILPPPSCPAHGQAQVLQVTC
jgi:hypothetical protein